MDRGTLTLISRSRPPHLCLGVDRDMLDILYTWCNAKAKLEKTTPTQVFRDFLEENRWMMENEIKEIEK